MFWTWFFQDKFKGWRRGLWERCSEGKLGLQPSCGLGKMSLAGLSSSQIKCEKKQRLPKSKIKSKEMGVSLQGLLVESEKGLREWHLVSREDSCEVKSIHPPLLLHICETRAVSYMAVLKNISESSLAINDCVHLQDHCLVLFFILIYLAQWVVCHGTCEVRGQLAGVRTMWVP